MFLLFILVPIMGLYLNNDQYYSIIKLVRNKKLLPYQRDKINTILYQSHEKYAIKNSLLFKNKHYYKCKKIPNDEIIHYGKMGLYKAIEKYNGKTNFTYFAGMYIDFELKEALSDAYSLSILSKRERQKSKKNYTLQELSVYNNLMEVGMRKDINHWNNYEINDLSSKLLMDIDNKENVKKIWDFIYTLDRDVYRIVNLKYDFEFNKKKSNKEIAELMCFSTETIRQKLLIFKNKLKEYLFSINKI